MSNGSAAKDCFIEFKYLSQKKLHYLFIAMYCFGVIVNIINFFVSCYFKQARRRTVSQFHSGYLLGSTIVFANFLYASIDALAGFEITCSQAMVSFVAYELGTSLSISFLVVFGKLQYLTLTTINVVVTSNILRKRNRQTSVLCAILNFVTIFLVVTICVIRYRKLIAIVLLYKVTLNIVAIYFSFKSYNTTLNNNPDNCLVRNNRFERAKKDLQIINRAVISTGVASGINISVYFLMALPLSSAMRECLIWIGRIYVVPLIFESVLYFFVSRKTRIAENQIIISGLNVTKITVAPFVTRIS